jgi:hypothetical protein
MPRRSQSPITRKHEPALSHMPAQRPSMLQTMKEGLAFGVGNAIAHRMIMGASLQQQQPQQQQQQQMNPEYIQCIKEYNDKSVCETLYLGSPPQQQKQEPTHQLNLNPEYIQCIKEYNEKSVCETLFLKK